MRATENQGSFLNRISIRRNQVVSMDAHHEHELEEFDQFQKHVADRFSGFLSPAADSDPLLSISWFRKLLDAFLCCEAEFMAVLVMGRDPAQFAKPPLDKLIPELLERSVKALDICNAVTHGLELVRQWQKLGRIAVGALNQRPIGDGQVRRAKKALTTLLTSMALDDKERTAAGKAPERNWSLGRRGGVASAKETTSGSFRSLSWTVAKSWSASKQIQAMSSNLTAPRGGEPTGLASPVYATGTVLVFVMWAMVAAVPCQERNGLGTHFPVPKQLGWAQPIVGLQEKIGEEWKKKEKKGSSGLLEEVQRLEKVAQSLVDFAGSFQFPAEEEEEVAASVAELEEVCRRMEGLVPLQQQVREVFHRIVKSRAEVVDVIENIANDSSSCGEEDGDEEANENTASEEQDEEGVVAERSSLEHPIPEERASQLLDKRAHSRRPTHLRTGLVTIFGRAVTSPPLASESPASVGVDGDPLDNLDDHEVQILSIPGIEIAICRSLLTWLTLSGRGSPANAAEVLSQLQGTATAVDNLLQSQELGASTATSPAIHEANPILSPAADQTCIRSITENVAAVPDKGLTLSVLVDQVVENMCVLQPSILKTTSGNSSSDVVPQFSSFDVSLKKVVLLTSMITSVRPWRRDHWGLRDQEGSVAPCAGALSVGYDQEESMADTRCGLRGIPSLRQILTGIRLASISLDWAKRICLERPHTFSCIMEALVGDRGVLLEELAKLLDLLSARTPLGTRAHDVPYLGEFLECLERRDGNLLELSWLRQRLVLFGEVFS